jgi:hypothetical protein
VPLLLRLVLSSDPVYDIVVYVAIDVVKGSLLVAH